MRTLVRGLTAATGVCCPATRRPVKLQNDLSVKPDQTKRLLMQTDRHLMQCSPYLELKVEEDLLTCMRAKSQLTRSG